MSCMLCCECDRLVDTDGDPESLYCAGYDDKCVCESCRDDLGLTQDED